MKKTLLSIALVIGLIGATTIANAQNGRFSVGAELGLPMGDFGDVASMGFGGSLRYELPVSDNIGVTATAGYLMFSGKSEGGFDFPDWSMIPVQIGGKYYITDNQEGLYFGVEVGIHSSKVKTPAYTYTDPFTGLTFEVPSASATSTDLSYAPEVGYHLANIDLGLRYQMVATEGATTSYLGLRIAYVFGEQ